jgi:hypothetical protein
MDPKFAVKAHRARKYLPRARNHGFADPRCCRRQRYRAERSNQSGTSFDTRDLHGVEHSRERSACNRGVAPEYYDPVWNPAQHGKGHSGWRNVGLDGHHGSECRHLRFGRRTKKPRPIEVQFIQTLLKELMLLCTRAHDDDCPVDARQASNEGEARVTLELAGPEWVGKKDHVCTNRRGHIA